MEAALFARLKHSRTAIVNWIATMGNFYCAATQRSGWPASKPKPTRKSTTNKARIYTSECREKLGTRAMSYKYLKIYRAQSLRSPFSATRRARVGPYSPQFSTHSVNTRRAPAISKDLTISWQVSIFTAVKYWHSS